MEASIKQQVSELIKGSKDILLVSHKNPDGDALGSLLALKIVLEKLGKKVTAVTADAPNPIFDFLPRIGEIKREVEGSSDLIVSLDISKAEISKIGYKKDENAKKVNIMITPRDGERFTPQDVVATDSRPTFDLVISVDTPNLERLGEIANPADLFYEIPLINIDHHPSNEKFGKLNLIELVATSSAEILVSLFESISKDNQLLDGDIATCLLTGLIYDTSSFQNVNTTPKSLTVAAQLVAAGGRQQEIVKSLYKTKSMETLKLWGLVLTKVKEDSAHKFLWSAVSKEEITQTGADEAALSGVVDELLKSATDVDFAMLLSERDGHLHGSLRSIAKGVNVASIAEAFGGGGHEVAAAFRIEGDLKSNEDQVLTKICKIREKSLGLTPSTVIEDKLPEKAPERAPEKKPDEKVEVEPAKEITEEPVQELEKEVKTEAKVDLMPLEQETGKEKPPVEIEKEKSEEEPPVEENQNESKTTPTVDEKEVNGDAQRALNAITADFASPVMPEETVSAEKKDSDQGQLDKHERIKTKW